MTKYTITPWRTQADLLKVRNDLFTATRSEVVTSQQDAVERVMAWKLRGNLPHAVESTALLVDATLHHKNKQNSSFSIRAVYSAAFCRFVTGFCDIGRHKERSLEPSSMLEIAKQIDMPTEFVSLRHEATHEELPSIQRLVVATRQALSWLWKVYWSRLEELESTESELSSRAALKDEVTVVLRRFRKSRRDALRNQTQTISEQHVDRDQTCDMLESKCKGSRSRVKLLAGVLVEDGLLLPGSRELGASLEGAFMIWDDLLQHLRGRLRCFYEDLIMALLETIAKPTVTDPETDSEKEALSMWVLHILDSESKYSTNKIKLAGEIMKVYCLYPGYWTRKIGLEAMQVDEHVQADWGDLFDATSTIAQPEELVVDGVVAGASSERSNAHVQENNMDVDEMSSQREDTDFGGGWRRAIIAPNMPLGVVK